MTYYRSTIVNQAKAWIGCKESDGSHKKIIDLYNRNTSGYNMKYTDAWCACFASAVAIKCGYTKIIPTSVNCNDMIAKFKKMNCWVENDAYVPKSGDYIFYDWDDNGKGDNTGSSDHVGIVEKVEGKVITVIEGNCSDSVKRRTIKVNGRYIRGYGIPKYGTETIVRKSVEAIAKEVIAGKWGNGSDRTRRLTEAGYDAKAVQKKVNELLSVANK